MELVARLKSLATDNWRKTLVVTTSVVLVLLIAVTLARFVWLVVDGPSVAPGAAPAQPVAAATPAPRRYSPEQARQWQLFGSAAAAPGATGSEAAPDTNLALQLLGVFSTRDDKLAGAVIAERGKDGELYRVGTPVPGGATLEKVEPDKVLLRRRGQLETLKFDAAPGNAGATANEGPRAPADMAVGMRGLRERLGQPPADEPEGGGDAAQGRFAAMAQQVKENPDAVLNELGLKVAPGGSGYLVGDGAGAEAMRNLGLRPGDVVLSVNGRALGNAQNDARFVDEVKASGEARVEIRRGSQVFTVNYPL